MPTRSEISVVSAAAAALASCALAVPALAAERWVAPTPKGEGDCTSPANAGTIEEGFGFCGAKGGFAEKGDEIIVTPGTYTIEKALNAPDGGRVHGLAGSQRPRIVEPSSAGSGKTTLNTGTSQVSYLEVQNEAKEGIAVATGSLDENVIAIATGTGGSAISNSFGESGLVRDSVAETTGGAGISINGGFGGSTRVQNVTAFSTGAGSYGIQASVLGGIEGPSGECLLGSPLPGGQVTAENTIAHGTADDVATITLGCGSGMFASVGLDYSNFNIGRTSSGGGPVIDNGNNQTSAEETDPKAIFKNLATSPPELQERANAPTIDAGIADAFDGPSDPEGHLRFLGAAPDIGAFEFKPLGEPTTVTTSLVGGGKAGGEITVPEGTAVSDTATLNGTNASKATGAVSYKVYSDSLCTKLVTEAGAPVTVTAGSVPASEPETLAPGTYYWKARYSGDSANAPSSSVCGAEIETVQAIPTTPTPTPTPTPIPTPTPTPPPAGSPPAKVITFTLSGAPRELADGSLEFTLLATGPGSFTGTATATLPVGTAGAAAKHKGSRKRTLLYGGGRAKATGPGVVHLRIKPTAAAVKALRKYKRLNLRVTISFQPTTGATVVKTTSATVKVLKHAKGKTGH
jgi:hypothetical protein